MSQLVCYLAPSMCSSDMNERKKVWQKLSSLLKTYDRLYDTEQAFLLEVTPLMCLTDASSLLITCVPLSLSRSNLWWCLQGHVCKLTALVCNTSMTEGI